ncbi:glycosyltransferase family 4 protein [Lacibacter sp. MH-610]|uniref:glycosyltransferase family 4 protein n=1 Tax=Lacibacter sp. MH-610 TaxID=3020883 RepID=UPI0038924841
MKKIAAIVPYSFLPAQSGGQKLIAGFYDALGRKAELHVIGTPDNDPRLVQAYTLKHFLRSSQLRYADFFSFFRLKNYLKQQQVEWLFIEHPYLGWLAWLLKKSTGVQLAVHTHNIEFQRFRSIGKWWWPLLKWYEGRVLNIADLVFCITEEDRQGFITDLKVRADKCVVIPYGIPQEEPPVDKAETKAPVCHELGISTEHHLLFFNGVLNYEPNRQALDAIIEKINPALVSSGLKYKLLIAGKNLPVSYNDLKDHPHIVYLGFVDDIDRYTKAADLLLNPVQSGGGIKTKMIEALAMNTAVVSVKTGAAGVVAELCGNKLTIVPDNDWPQFTNAIITALQGPDSVTPPVFYKTFSWKYIVEKVMQQL